MGFPQHSLYKGEEVWRVHLAEKGPWYFGSEGRFALTAPGGTCYAAATPMTAVCEVLDRQGLRVIHSSDLRARVIRVMPLARDFELADTATRHALAFRLSRGFAAEPEPYERCRAWATAFATGHDGIRYWARRDLSRDGYAYALFAKAGERRSWRRGRAESLDRPEWHARISRETGIPILPEDASGDLEFRTEW